MANTEDCAVRVRVRDGNNQIKSTLFLYPDAYEFDGWRYEIDWKNTCCITDQWTIPFFLGESHNPVISFRGVGFQTPWFILKNEGDLGLVRRQLQSYGALVARKSDDSMKTLSVGMMTFPDENTAVTSDLILYGDRYVFNGKVTMTDWSKASYQVDKFRVQTDKSDSI